MRTYLEQVSRNIPYEVFKKERIREEGKIIVSAEAVCPWITRYNIKYRGLLARDIMQRAV